jgi:hypothetical protein
MVLLKRSNLSEISLIFNRRLLNTSCSMRLIVSRVNTSTGRPSCCTSSTDSLPSRNYLTQSFAVGYEIVETFFDFSQGLTLFRQKLYYAAVLNF